MYMVSVVQGEAVLGRTGMLGKDTVQAYHTRTMAVVDMALVSKGLG